LAPESQPIPMILHCPECGERHVDVGEFATKLHHTHACQVCGMVWRPAIGPTVGVQFLPGFKNDPATPSEQAETCGTIVRQIDPKFHIDPHGHIVKTSSGEIVPEWEPLILQRSRDHLLLPLLRHYRKLCVVDGCNDYQLGMLDQRIQEFERFAAEHPEWMKQPGITRGDKFVPLSADEPKGEGL